MHRILVGTPATLSVLFAVDGVPADPSPSTATVTIARDDATVFVDEAAATRVGVGEFTYDLTTTDTGRCDVLQAIWTSSLGQITTLTEVVGGFHFTLAEARRVKPLGDTATYPTDRLAEARTLAETALEDACAVPFVPRYFRKRLDGRGRCNLMLPRSRPLSILSATVDGSSIDVDDLELYDDGRVYRAQGWAAGRRNVVIAGTYGYPFAPPRVSRASLLLAKRFIVDSPVNDRATSLTTEDGTTSYLVTAGVKQAVTDVPEANAVIALYGMRDAYTVA